jgi:hypothetical protein
MNNGGGVMSEFTVYYRCNVPSIFKSRTDSEEDNEDVGMED